MHQYEIAVLYHPDLEVDLSKAEEKVKKIVTGNGGKVVKEDNWGKRKLAYDIKGSEYAIYVFYTVELPGEVREEGREHAQYHRRSHPLPDNAAGPEGHSQGRSDEGREGRTGRQARRPGRQQ